MITMDEPSTSAIADLAAWCGRQRLFANWSPETLRDYLAFHQRQGTLTTAQTYGTVRAVGLAWGCDRREVWTLWRTALTHGHTFRWRPQPTNAEMLFLSEVVAESRADLAQLIWQMLNKTPGWDAKPIWTFRRGELHRLSNDVILALARGKGAG